MLYIGVEAQAHTDAATKAVAIAAPDVFAERIVSSIRLHETLPGFVGRCR